MIYFKKILIYFLLIQHNVEGYYNFAESIKELVAQIEKPSKLTAMVCWPLGFRLRFAKEMFAIKSTTQKSILFGMQPPKIENFPNVRDEHHHFIIVDLNCPENFDFLKNVGSKLTHNFKWIILENNHVANKIENIFINLPALVNSEIYHIFQNKNEDIIINQIYRISENGDVITEKYGILKANKTFIKLQLNSVASIRRKNLLKTNLRATLVITHNDTLNHLTDYRDRHIDTISKVCYLLTNYLVDYVNGDLIFYYKNSWGYMNNETKRWSGMIGDLVENQSDIGASALFYTSDRIAVIEYIAMTNPTRSKFVFRSPKLSFTENVYLLPFDEYVWVSLFGMEFVTSLVLLFAIYFEWKAPLRDNNLVSENQDSGVLKPSVMDIFFVVFGASCQQGSFVLPRSLAARIIMMVAFTILMFLYTSYSANIVALLQSPSNKIRTLEDLLNSRLQLGVDDTVFNHYYFPAATEPIRKQIYERKIRNKNGTENFMSLENGIRKISDGLFAFHMETGVGYHIVEEIFFEDEKCGLQEIQYLQVIDPYYAIQKNSSYKELFKIGLMRINEHGLQERENSKLYTKKPKCVGGGSKFISSSLIDTKPTLLILLWGAFLAACIMSLEIFFHKKVNVHRQKLIPSRKN